MRGRGGGGAEKACLRDFGVVSVIKFKLKFVNKFCSRLYIVPEILPEVID